MLSFDTKAALELISHSAGGFSYDTLARALISDKKHNLPNTFCLIAVSFANP